ncbi:MAG: hypothetical protein QM396_02875 [Euryarchaeota archaeon]|jgi:hypothetical protein|uniref:hypothetical protein n=1 Tax=Methanobacterium sp. MZD130B TaxID=3394378 RepID=UPI001759BF80|nr:hypothetical protein [Euryarchaeota archaeon]HHT18395.1 hypothetical protein [Methanobacterium sp.]
MKISNICICLVLICFAVIACGCTSNDSGSTNGVNDSSGSSTSSSSVSSSNDEPSASTSPSPSIKPRVLVIVDYWGKWSGTISSESGTRSIEGSGKKSFDLGNISGGVAANVQKKDGGSDTLAIFITKDGNIVASQKTSAGYGVVQVSA